MMQRGGSLAFLTSMLGVFVLSVSNLFSSDGLFLKVAEVSVKDGHFSKATLLPRGEVVCFWEKTRPPTDEEKKLRAAWFDEQWEAFRKRAEQKGILEIERKSEEIAKELESEIAKQPPLVRSMRPFFSAATRGLPMLMRQALKMAYPLARKHFVNQPVVLEAGLKVWHIDGKEKTIPVDVEELYGEETWTRTPIETLNLRSSPDGQYLAIETEESLVLFELKGDEFIPVAQVNGQSPFGWSQDGRLMFVARGAPEDTFIVYEMEGLREVASLGPVPRPAKRFSVIRAIAISDDLFAVGGGNILCIYRLSDGSVRQPDKRTLARIGGSPDSVINGLVFSQDGRKLYVTSARGFFIIDPYTFAILDEYILPFRSDFYFDKLAGISPDGRYAAVLYGRERLHGWATLFFWEIRERRVVQKIGTERGKMLSTISAGFRFVYPPAILTNDWQFLLTVRQDGVLELYRGR